MRFALSLTTLRGCRGGFCIRGAGGSTEQLLGAIGSGKANAGIAMIARWPKPVKQWFDVEPVAGVHRGCSYLVASRDAGIKDIPT